MSEETKKRAELPAVGARATRERTITDADIVRFAEVSGDRNPVHLDEEYAARSPFGRRVAHGFLTVALLYVLGWLKVGKAGRTGLAGDPWAPYYLFELDPIIYGLIVSFALGIVVSLVSQPLPARTVDPFFLEETEANPLGAEGTA